MERMRAKYPIQATDGTTTVDVTRLDVPSGSISSNGVISLTANAVSSAYATLGEAITAIGSAKTVLVIDSNLVCDSTCVVPATLQFEGYSTYAITKSGSGTIEFEGFGLTDPVSQVPIFSGFATGNITWTGTDAPASISTELWNTGNVSLTQRLDRANGAFPSKTVQIICYPRTITGTTTFSENRSLYFMAGDYPNTIATNIYPFRFLSNFSATGDAGAIINLSATNGSGFIPDNASGTYTNIFFDGLYLLADAEAAGVVGNSVILTGNALNGSITNCIFENCRQYVVLGGRSDLGYYGENLSAVNNTFINCPTQALDVINAINWQLVGNRFDTRGCDDGNNFILIDIEPNAATDVIENGLIAGNTFDMRPTSGYAGGIQVQAGSCSNIANITIADNVMIGDSDYLFLIGIGCYGVDGLTVTNNKNVYGASTPFQIQNCKNVVVDDNDCYRSSTPALNLAAIALTGVFDSEVNNNTLSRNKLTITGEAKGIVEAELVYVVTTTGSTVSCTFPDVFYSWWVGKTVTINSVDYVVATVTDYDTLTTTAPVGTYSGNLTTKFSNNTYSGNGANKVTLSSTGTSQILSTYTDKKTTDVADVAYTVLPIDGIIVYISLSAPRIVTLPTAVGCKGKQYEIKDGAGAAATHNITVDGDGGETIDGAANVVINANYGKTVVMSNGTNWLTI